MACDDDRPIAMQPPAMDISESAPTETQESEPRQSDGGDVDHPTPASTRVFAIVELAEQILLDLPIKDILYGAQQVCRQWRDVIQDSDLIQEHLFMKPISKNRLYFVQIPLSKEENYSLCHWADLQQPLMSRPVLENPFLILLSHEDICVKEEAFTRPEASWRRMQVTQPPVGEMEVSRDRGWTLQSFAPSGVLLNDLVGENSGPLVSIDGWSHWIPHKDTDSGILRELKSNLRHTAVASNEDRGDQDDDLWWMPDEHLYGL